MKYSTDGFLEVEHCKSTRAATSTTDLMWHIANFVLCAARLTDSNLAAGLTFYINSWQRALFP